MKSDALQDALNKRFETAILSSKLVYGQLTIEVHADHLYEMALALRDEYGFEQLIDICGVDYLDYGSSEWETDNATASGFDRGVERIHPQLSEEQAKRRFAVVYHFLSLSNNQRIRLRTFAEEPPYKIDSVVEIWNAANWFEREAFDLYGILFDGHPDLRRLLTDYGFIGHPFRKDFPLSGEVEVRYDATQKRVLYEPVDIEPRVLVPKVIRKDNRYIDEK